MREFVPSILRTARKQSLWASFLGLMTLFVLVSVAEAQTYTVLHSFGSPGDGIEPMGIVLTQGTPPTYWGSTWVGGSNYDGTIFRITYNNGSWAYGVLADFNGSYTGENGDKPYNVNPSGYGVAAGGYGGYGEVYHVTVSGAMGVLYNFPLNSNGIYPVGAVANTSSHIYGVTTSGGSTDYGVLYSLTTSSPYTETILHNFTAGADGIQPRAGVVMSSSGALYGTTYSGSKGYLGTVFSYNTNTQIYKVMHSFTGTPDGAGPYAELTLDSAGDVLGTTSGGGKYNYGTVFKITAAGQEKILYSFTGGTDGATPEGQLLLDSAGDIFGSASGGGVSPGNKGLGTLWEINADGGFSVLHTFCTVSGCPDGAVPVGQLAWEDGFEGSLLVGITQKGGAYYNPTTGNPAGVIFQLAP